MKKKKAMTASISLIVAMRIVAVMLVSQGGRRCCWRTPPLTS